MITIDLILSRTAHDGAWAEYTVKYSGIPNHGHLYFPVEVSPALVQDVLEDLLNSGDQENGSSVPPVSP